MSETFTALLDGKCQFLHIFLQENNTTSCHHHSRISTTRASVETTFTMSDGAVVVKTRKFKRNPLLSRRQVCVKKRMKRNGESRGEKLPCRRQTPRSKLPSYPPFHPYCTLAYGGGKLYALSQDLWWLTKWFAS
jgi:hypothetical protein